MKILMKIYFKYFAMSLAVALLFLAVELGITFQLGQHWGEVERFPVGGSQAVGEIAESIKLDEDGQVCNGAETAKAIQATGAEWAMLLSGEGEVVWEENLPDGFARRYFAGEIAAFSRWYLEDYPVIVWKLGERLFVAGYPEGSFMRYNSLMRISEFHYYAKTFFLCLGGAALLALVLILLMGFLYYRKMRALIQAIIGLSRGEDVALSRGESFGEVAGYINETSRKLKEQQEMLKKRDESRTEWISGVSHDIRTPLAIVMGNAELIEEREGVDAQARKAAGMIKEQSLRIRSLIEDLNLTSKLAYHMQPLRLREVSLAALVRQAAAACVNQLGSGEERYPIEISLTEEFQKKRLQADGHLLLRALENVIGNAVRHNPQGCRIQIRGFLEEGRCRIAVSDSGRGIPPEVAACVNGNGESTRHIMGLRLVCQIVQAHGGWVRITLPSEVLLAL